MARKIIQDIIVKNKKESSIKRGVKSILPTNENFKKENHPDIFNKKTYEDNYNYAQNWEPEKERVSKSSTIFLWVISVALIVTILFLLSSVFATAKVFIFPKNADIKLNNTYTITNNRDLPGLHYEVITIEKTLSKSLETDGEENVERKASGKAIIYNNYSNNNQRLINNTRLETKDGLIYRIRDSVDIPGMKNGIPGSVEVEIIADEPGEKFNMKVSDLKGDFKIPGLKGSPKYESIFARLSSDTTGGYIGKVKKVSSEKLSAGRDELKNNLKTELIKEIYLQKPEGFIIFNNNYYFSINDLPDTQGIKDYIISEKGTVHAITFNKKDLAYFLAKEKIEDFNNSKVNMIWDDSNFSSEIIGTTQKPWNENNLRVKFIGNAKIVWEYSPNEIIDEILGQEKTYIKDVLEKYKNSIVDINVKITPPWNNFFPKNPNKIKIIDSINDNIANK